MVCVSSPSFFLSSFFFLFYFSLFRCWIFLYRQTFHTQTQTKIKFFWCHQTEKVHYKAPGDIQIDKFIFNDHFPVFVCSFSHSSVIVISAPNHQLLLNTKQQKKNLFPSFFFFLLNQPKISFKNFIIQPKIPICIEISHFSFSFYNKFYRLFAITKKWKKWEKRKGKKKKKNKK